MQCTRCYVFELHDTHTVLGPVLYLCMSSLPELMRDDDSAER